MTSIHNTSTVKESHVTSIHNTSTVKESHVTSIHNMSIKIYEVNKQKVIFLVETRIAFNILQNLPCTFLLHSCIT